MFNIIAWINESKILKKHISWKYRYKSDEKKLKMEI